MGEAGRGEEEGGKGVITVIATSLVTQAGASRISSTGPSVSPTATTYPIAVPKQNKRMLTSTATAITLPRMIPIGASTRALQRT